MPSIIIIKEELIESNPSLCLCLDFAVTVSASDVASCPASQRRDRRPTREQQPHSLSLLTLTTCCSSGDMSDLLDDFIAFLEKDDQPNKGQVRSAVKRRMPADISHTNVDYKNVVSARSDLKATYSGIIPGSKGAQVQQSVTDTAFALLGPCGVSTSLTNRVKSRVAKAAAATTDPKEPSDQNNVPVPTTTPTDAKATDVNGQPVPALTKKQQEKKRQMEEELRKELEAEMIAEAVKNPLTLAARNFAQAMKKKAIMCSEAEGKPYYDPVVRRQKTSVGSRVNLSEFTNADEIFSKLKPVRDEVVTASRPQLGRGCDPSSNVLLGVDAGAKKPHVRLPRRKSKTVTPFDVMNHRKKSPHVPRLSGKEKGDIEFVFLDDDESKSRGSNAAPAAKRPMIIPAPAPRPPVTRKEHVVPDVPVVSLEKAVSPPVETLVHLKRKEPEIEVPKVPQKSMSDAKRARLEAIAKKAQQAAQSDS